MQRGERTASLTRTEYRPLGNPDPARRHGGAERGADRRRLGNASPTSATPTCTSSCAPCDRRSRSPEKPNSCTRSAAWATPFGVKTVDGAIVPFRCGSPIWFSSVFFAGLALFGAVMWLDLKDTLTSGRSRTLERRADRLGDLLRDTRGGFARTARQKVSGVRGRDRRGADRGFRDEWDARSSLSDRGRAGFPLAPRHADRSRPFSEVTFLGQPYRVLAHPFSSGSQALVLCAAAPLEGNRPSCAPSPPACCGPSRRCWPSRRSADTRSAEERSNRWTRSPRPPARSASRICPRGCRCRRRGTSCSGFPKPAMRCSRAWNRQ